MEYYVSDKQLQTFTTKDIDLFQFQHSFSLFKARCLQLKNIDQIQQLQVLCKQFLNNQHIDVTKLLIQFNFRLLTGCSINSKASNNNYKLFWIPFVCLWCIQTFSLIYQIKNIIGLILFPLLLILCISFSQDYHRRWTVLSLISSSIFVLSSFFYMWWDVLASLVLTCINHHEFIWIALIISIYRKFNSNILKVSFISCVLIPVLTSNKHSLYNKNHSNEISMVFKLTSNTFLNHSTHTPLFHTHIVDFCSTHSNSWFSQSFKHVYSTDFTTVKYTSANFQHFINSVYEQNADFTSNLIMIMSNTVKFNRLMNFNELFVDAAIQTQKMYECLKSIKIMFANNEPVLSQMILPHFREPPVYEKTSMNKHLYELQLNNWLIEKQEYDKMVETFEEQGIIYKLSYGAKRLVYFCSNFEQIDELQSSIILYYIYSFFLYLIVIPIQQGNQIAQLFVSILKSDNLLDLIQTITLIYTRLYCLIMLFDLHILIQIVFKPLKYFINLQSSASSIKQEKQKLLELMDNMLLHVESQYNSRQIVVSNCQMFK